MSRWSMCSKSKLKLYIMTGSECNNLLGHPMPMCGVRSLQMTRSFSRTYLLLKDHYAALGVAKSATQQDIKNAYYRFSKMHHPDKNKGCENSAKMFRIATEAYEVLGNYRTRRLYDKGIGIISKKYTQGDEVAPIVDEDDAQTKFYKQHARRSERPHVSGRTTIYDFDEWASKTISESFQKAQEIKRDKEIDDLSRKEQDQSSHMVHFFVMMVIIVLALFTVMTWADSQDNNGRNKRR